MSEDPLEEGLHHLEAAAREMIQAGRSFLDAVDSVVGRPGGIEAFLRTMTGRDDTAGGTAEPDGGDDEPFEEIPVE